MKIQKLTPLILALFLFGCGKDSNNNKGESSNEARNNEVQEEVSYPPDGSNIEGKYIARFTTLNPHVNGTVPGSVTFFREKDRVMVYLRLFAGYPKAWHQQKIYEGTRCPTLADDTNGDGYIDIVEAEAVLGKVLIPLDADISSQRSGRSFYPLGDPSGSYFYERTTSFSRLFRDLKDIKNASEEFKKLGPDEGFSLEGKAVLVQGVSQEVEFPETVASTSRYKPFQTIPIVCGIFVEDNQVTGTLDDGEIPGPIADIEEGQDRPARDGDGETERDDPPSRDSDRTNDADSGNSPTVDSDGRSPTQPSPRPPRDYGDNNSNEEEEDSGGGRRFPWPWGGGRDNNDTPPAPETPREEEVPTTPSPEETTPPSAPAPESESEE
ncbi:MAG TPA: hypothetical protein VKZ84_04895 [Bacteriovoracaceae bacterium]|nr:hypothetical protein [Bacteriovoracaceae bacterium]